MNALSAREGYPLWAPQYETETAVSYLEELTVRRLGVETVGRGLLDVGCGTGRRLRQSRASLAIGVDLSPEMLVAGPSREDVAAGDVRALPFASATFDVVWCRLVIGHVRDIAPCYAELARVCASSGIIIVSDICPDAIAAGHRRTFRDATGSVHEVEHFVHPAQGHIRAAGAAALELDSCIDGVIGEAIEPFYVRAGRSRAYELQRGQSLVRVMSWRRTDRVA